MQIYTTLNFISPQIEWLYSKAKATINAGEDVAKQELLYTISGNAN
jgi:hypothetical protein